MAIFKQSLIFYLCSCQTIFPETLTYSKLTTIPLIVGCMSYLFRDASCRKIIESYCPVCGIFLAASPEPSMLKFIEGLHRCPPRDYDSQDYAREGRCRIARYLPKVD
jgi:hypothetical protein